MNREETLERLEPRNIFRFIVTSSMYRWWTYRQASLYTSKLVSIFGMQWDKSENKKKEEKKKIYIGIENTVACLCVQAQCVPKVFGVFVKK